MMKIMAKIMATYLAQGHAIVLLLITTILSGLFILTNLFDILDIGKFKIPGITYYVSGCIAVR
jgi:hypothetical protein